MNPVFLLLTAQKKSILVSVVSIRDIVSMKKGRGSFIMYDDESSQAVEQSVEEIADALAGMNLIRKPANN